MCCSIQYLGQYNRVLLQDLRRLLRKLMDQSDVPDPFLDGHAVAGKLLTKRKVKIEVGKIIRTCRLLNDSADGVGVKRQICLVSVDVRVWSHSQAMIIGCLANRHAILILVNRRNQPFALTSPIAGQFALWRCYANNECARSLRPSRNSSRFADHPARGSSSPVLYFLLASRLVLGA